MKWLPLLLESTAVLIPFNVGTNVFFSLPPAQPRPRKPDLDPLRGTEGSVQVDVFVVP